MSNLRCGMLLPDGPEEMADAIAGGLNANGCDVDFLSSQDLANLKRYRFLLGYGPMRPLTRTIERLQTMQDLPPLVFWFTEQAPHPHWRGPLLKSAARLRYAVERGAAPDKLRSLLTNRAGRLLSMGELLALQRTKRLTQVYVFTEANRQALLGLKLPVEILPMGYAPSFGGDQALKRDIDVIFLGSARDSRRGPLLQDLEHQLSRLGVNFVIKDGSGERGVAFGDQRTLLLNRSKIMVSLMRQPWDDPVFRLLLAAPNKAMVLSEKVLPACWGPFQPGTHFAMVEGNDLTGAVQHYLANASERQQIADAAYAFVTDHLTMKRMAGHILEALPTGMSVRR